jgi:hypothetical protein
MAKAFDQAITWLEGNPSADAVFFLAVIETRAGADSERSWRLLAGDNLNAKPVGVSEPRYKTTTG